MFNTAIVVFRETLEAALIVGIVAAATRPIPRSSLWIGLGVLAGVAGAIGMAAAAEQIGAWANGMGHELFNATVLAIAVGMLSWHNVWMARHGRELADQARKMGASVTKGELALSAISVVIAVTVLREGAETVLFLYGIFAGSGVSQGTMFEGAIIGLLGGVGTGALLYRGLTKIPVRHFFTVTSWLLLLVVAGMASQLAQLLIQADVLSPMVQPLWDTSRWISADSSAGTLLHAMVGYDPEPSATQVVFASVALVVVFLASRIAQHRPDS